MPRKAFEIAGASVPAGIRDTIALNVPGQSQYTPMQIPIHVVHGRRDGPVLFISATIHGDEINGIEIIRQLRHHRSLDRIKGTLICVPIVNMYGFLNQSRYLPDRRDLNRSFPGSPKGSLAGRLAHVFAREIVDRSSYGIDLHTGANHRTNFPHIRADMEDDETRKLAFAFGAPVAIASNLRDGSLRQYGIEKGLKMLLYEAGEGLRFDRLSIQAGVRGILNVMAHLGMIGQRSSRKKAWRETMVAKASEWVRAPMTGLMRPRVALGTSVKKGEIISTIADAIGENEVAVLSSTDGIVIGQTNLPLVREGDALFHIARWENHTHADQVLDAFDESHDLKDVRSAEVQHLEGLSTGDFAE